MRFDRLEIITDPHCNVGELTMYDLAKLYEEIRERVTVIRNEVARVKSVPPIEDFVPPGSEDVREIAQAYMHEIIMLSKRYVELKRTSEQYDQPLGSLATSSDLYQAVNRAFREGGYE